MPSKPDASMPFLNLGKEQTETMLSMQKELLDAYDQSSRAWLARVKSEVDLWSDLAKKLSATQSVPDAVGACQQCVAQRMQMAAEDGRRLYDDCQKIRKRSRGHCRMDGRPQARETRSPEEPLARPDVAHGAEPISNNASDMPTEPRHQSVRLPHCNVRRRASRAGSELERASAHKPLNCKAPGFLSASGTESCAPAGRRAQLPGCFGRARASGRRQQVC